MIRTGLIITIISLIAMLSMNVWVFGQLPEGNIPVHWGLDGQPDRFSDRAEATFILWFVPAAMLFAGTVFALAPTIEPLRENLINSRKAYTVIWSSVMLVTLALHAGIVMLMVRSLTNDQASNDYIRFIIAVTAILFIIKGNYLPKTRQNWFLGIRTPWTLSSPYTWEKTHKLGGHLFMAAGLICLVGAFVLEGKWVLTLLIGTLMPAVIITIIYSYIVWRGAPDKAIPPDYIV